MSHPLIHRMLSLGLATVLTLAMLSSIDGLAQREQPAGHWAQKAAQTAARG